MQNKSQLPKNANLKFKGEIFEVWQWEQKMFDGSVEIFEKLRRPDTAQVIPIVGNKILIQKQRQPDKLKSFISIPGGRCELNEKPLNSAKRELLEETGYASKKWKLFKKQNPVNKIIWTVYTYIARDCFYKQKPELDAGEKIITKLVSFDEFLMLSEDKTFYEGELKSYLSRARFDKKFRKEFYELLFG
jgi:8-oxo-dGTP pyrophosphatase MutT (NUDIX family)